MLLAGRPVLMCWSPSPSSLSEDVRSATVVLICGADGLCDLERVEARAAWSLTEVAGGPVVEMRFRLRDVWGLGLVDRMPEREAVICPSAVAGLCGVWHQTPPAGGHVADWWGPSTCLIALFSSF